MKNYTVVFETDSGMEQVNLSLGNNATIRHVALTMRGLYPKYIGADGSIHDEEGKEYPLDWLYTSYS